MSPANGTLRRALDVAEGLNAVGEIGWPAYCKVVDAMLSIRPDGQPEAYDLNEVGPPEVRKERGRQDVFSCSACLHTYRLQALPSREAWTRPRFCPNCGCPVGDVPEYLRRAKADVSPESN